MRAGTTQRVEGAPCRRSQALRLRKGMQLCRPGRCCWRCRPPSLPCLRPMGIRRRDTRRSARLGLRTTRAEDAYGLLPELSCATHTSSAARPAATMSTTFLSDTPQQCCTACRGRRLSAFSFCCSRIATRLPWVQRNKQTDLRVCCPCIQGPVGRGGGGSL